MTAEEIDFIKREIEKGKWLESLKPEERITELCQKAECNEKLRKIHKHQYLHGQWNPHPSERFRRWWSGRGVTDTEEVTERGWVGIDATRAYNCEPVRECYRGFLQEQRAEMNKFKIV
jgi:hypothetical protein